MSILDEEMSLLEVKCSLICLFKSDENRRPRDVAGTSFYLKTFRACPEDSKKDKWMSSGRQRLVRQNANELQINTLVPAWDFKFIYRYI